ncbi:MAG: NADH-quinone oxidoreductase subunit C [Betaproteobacteria bacterium]|jgi:NADH-quinone oxidoreductase subunit C|nr:MAG: NADH-quinone oxidoreductase subunit C [Betaproteobacteria bacterium]
MNRRLQSLCEQLSSALEGQINPVSSSLGELTVVVPAATIGDVMLTLRDRAELDFSQLIDLCGVDYSGYAGAREFVNRFAVVYHLLSIEHNWRLRVRAYCEDDDFPVMGSVVSIWPAANWFEREAFDLFGIIFTGHPDLRRLLTDYGFVGHPFRKDFPLSGNVEMRYDPEQQRVIYQPVTIEPREIVPRVVREENYGDVE